MPPRTPQFALVLNLTLASYQNTVEKGLAKAQSYLGAPYVKGDGAKKNSEPALERFMKAARQDDTSSQFNPDCMYFTGEGVPVNQSKAIGWFF
ncbi:hypothetical protein BG015_011928 [Linnemannia schmuckeri]|uniref:Uncharacterized protein n=1 Tax=Linnemannia schmuckeri TaxID=64567 RepID=A0A9P5S810_9FUNG|nr:hypothetical protein BG015_011928 [Linnemannia schmuckeri]